MIKDVECPCGTKFVSEKLGRGRHPIYCQSCREKKASAKSKKESSLG